MQLEGLASCRKGEALKRTVRQVVITASEEDTTTTTAPPPQTVTAGALCLHLTRGTFFIFYFSAAAAYSGAELYYRSVFL
jgi:hypothetical protein